MKRKIMFRGKDSEGVWCFGDLRQRMDGIYVDLVRVDPETVGQYTGCVDKENGRQVFEGDKTIHFDSHLYEEKEPRVVRYEDGCFYNAPGAIRIVGNIHDEDGPV